MSLCSNFFWRGCGGFTCSGSVRHNLAKWCDCSNRSTWNQVLGPGRLSQEYRRQYLQTVSKCRAQAWQDLHASSAWFDHATHLEVQTIFDQNTDDFSLSPSSLGAASPEATSAAYIGLIVLIAGIIELSASDDNREPGDLDRKSVV